MRGECMVGHMCTYRRIFGAEPLRAPQVFEHATLSPTITFHSNAAAQSAAHERRRAATTAPLASSAVPNGGCAKLLGWVWRGAIFMCLLVRRLRWSAATPSSTARVPSTTPPLPLLAIGSRLVAKMLSPMTCGTPPQASLSAATAAARDRLASCACPRRQQQLGFRDLVHTDSDACGIQPNF